MALSHERSLSRPSIPLLLQCGVVFWLGCLLAEFLDYDLALSAALCLISLGLLFAISRYSRKYRNSVQLLLLWTLFIFLGAILMSVSINGLHHKREVLIGSDGATFAVRILEDPSKGSFGYSVPALITEPNSDCVRKQLFSYKVLLNYEDESFEYGVNFLQRWISFRSTSIIRTISIRKGLLLAVLYQICNQYIHRSLGCFPI